MKLVLYALCALLALALLGWAMNDEQKETPTVTAAPCRLLSSLSPEDEIVLTVCGDTLRVYRLIGHRKIEED